MHGLYRTLSCVLFTCAACTDGTRELELPCGGNIEDAPFGIRTALADQGRGIWGIDPATNEFVTDQTIVIRSAAGEFEVVTDASGLAPWPDEVAEEDSVDLTTRWRSNFETSWLGVSAGCVALSSAQPAWLLPPERPGAADTVQVGLRIDATHLDPSREYVLSLRVYGRSPLSNQTIPVGASEVVVAVQTPRGVAAYFEVTVLDSGEVSQNRDWSNVVAWGGGEILAPEDTQNGDVVAEFVVAPMVQDLLTMSLGPGVLGDSDGNEVAVSGFSRDGYEFRGPQVRVTEGQTEVKVALPDPGIAQIRDFSFELSSLSRDAFRWAAADALDARSFAPFPLMNPRRVQPGGGPFDLGQRDANANLSVVGAIFSNPSREELSVAWMFVFDDRQIINPTSTLAELMATPDASLSVQDIHLEDTEDPRILGDALPRSLGFVRQSIRLDR